MHAENVTYFRVSDILIQLVFFIDNILLIADWGISK